MNEKYEWDEQIWKIEWNTNIFLCSIKKGETRDTEKITAKIFMDRTCSNTEPENVYHQKTSLNEILKDVLQSKVIPNGRSGMKEALSFGQTFFLASSMHIPVTSRSKSPSWAAPCTCWVGRWSTGEAHPFLVSTSEPQAWGLTHVGLLIGWPLKTSLGNVKGAQCWTAAFSSTV